MNDLRQQLGQIGIGPDWNGRIVDLTMAIDPNLPGAEVSPAKSLDADGWNATTLKLYSRCGTHMDAPSHFMNDSTSIDRLDLAACIGPAKVIDMTPVEPRELLTIAHLGTWAEQIEPGDRLLLRTDWHHRYGTEEYRRNSPRISLELANWFAEQGVALVGVEPPSVADVNNLEEVTSVHQVLFRAEIVVVEGLQRLDLIRQAQVLFIALPLAIRGGDGSPVRAIAIESGA